jgi:pimeloyl-ACP methyl ester carboxylesterase
MAAAIPQCTFLKVPHAGHMAPLEQPEPVNAAIMAFMKNYDQNGRT